MEELVAASESAGSQMALSWRPSDPRFRLPGSGWYWEIEHDGKPIAHSDSLRYGHLAVDAGAASGVSSTVGPYGEALRVRWLHVSLPDLVGDFRYAVAGPTSDIAADVKLFAVQLGITLAVLGLGLTGAVLLQVQYGLRPIDQLRRGVVAVRAGRVERLTPDVPEELKPLVGEINDLLEHSASLVERARGGAGDLAHALKTPLAVIRNEAATMGGPQGALVREQVAAVDASVERYLSRARSVGAAPAGGARTPLGPVLNDLAFSMKRLYDDRGLQVEIGDVADLAFRGDAQDLEEMLGNLMDNACKWAQCRVRVGASRIGGPLSIIIEDDGPGIPAEGRVAALERGGRLDQAVSGSGLGLAIVRDLAELYRGALRLDASPLGGVRVTLELPAAE